MGFHDGFQKVPNITIPNGGEKWRITLVETNPRNWRSPTSPEARSQSHFCRNKVTSKNQVINWIFGDRINPNFQKECHINMHQYQFLWNMGNKNGKLFFIIIIIIITKLPGSTCHGLSHQPILDTTFSQTERPWFFFSLLAWRKSMDYSGPRNRWQGLNKPPRNQYIPGI